jgi:O-succinylbenzoic acid--CoA ligase
MIRWGENEQNIRKRTFKTKLKSFETYGNETITHIAAKQVGSVLFSFTQYQITTDDRNCLVIDAPLISNEQICTNDIVELVGENQFVFLGMDNIINSGGIKLIPEKN